jgi:hypothetical protein
MELLKQALEIVFKLFLILLEETNPFFENTVLVFELNLTALKGLAFSLQR